MRFPRLTRMVRVTIAAMTVTIGTLALSSCGSTAAGGHPRITICNQDLGSSRVGPFFPGGTLGTVQQYMVRSVPVTTILSRFPFGAAVVLRFVEGCAGGVALLRPPALKRYAVYAIALGSGSTPFDVIAIRIGITSFKQIKILVKRPNGLVSAVAIRGAVREGQ